MKNRLPGFEEPLNANERYLYAMAVRLDALCSMMSSFLEHYAENNRVPTTSNTVKNANTEKSIEDKKEEIVEEEQEEAKPKRKRRSKKTEETD